MIDTELSIFFLTTLFFTVLFLLSEEWEFRLFFGTLSTISWIIFGIMTYISAGTFQILGFLYIMIGVCIELFNVYLAISNPREVQE
jgi:hypothetical protein